MGNTLWAVRTKHGALQLWKNKPRRDGDGWADDAEIYTAQNDRITRDGVNVNHLDVLKSVAWEDGPVEVELTIIKPAKPKIEKSCENCRFKGGYPKCYKDDDEPCRDWAMHNGKAVRKNNV